MALSAFDDKASPPTKQSLATMLGRAGALWNEFKDGLQSQHGPLREEWSFSGKAFGWSLRMKEPKRTLVYMTPCRAHFLASFVMGEKACRAAQAAGLPAAVLELIEVAPKYAEGRGFRVPVRTRKDLESIRTLAAIKAAS